MSTYDYGNLLVEYDIMSVSILSQKDNYYTFIPNSYVFIGGGGVCRVSSYLQKRMTTRPFTVAVHV